MQVHVWNSVKIAACQRLAPRHFRERYAAIQASSQQHVPFRHARSIDPDSPIDRPANIQRAWE